MSEFLLQYEKVDPVSWAYLSSLLLVGLFFKFNRFWSVRNLDLVLLILLAPGLLMVSYGQRQERAVYGALKQDPELQKPVVDPASGRIFGRHRQPQRAADAPGHPPGGVQDGGSALRTTGRMRLHRIRRYRRRKSRGPKRS